MQVLFAQFLQNFRQHVVALFETGNSIHYLVVGSMASGFVQLHCQVCQFPGMGRVVAHHVFHQGQQFLHGFMAVMMIMVVIMVMQMLLGMVMIMAFLVMVGMAVFMMMLMGMGMAVVGMLVGMAVEMVVAVSAKKAVGNVHRIFSPFLCFRILLIPVSCIYRQFSGG